MGPAPRLEVHGLTGVPEVHPGADLAGLLAEALVRGPGLHPGDCLAVSSKVVSKALGLTWSGERAAAVAVHTRRVVAERASASGVTRVVEAAAGPVMAAAGVDASNTGPTGSVLLLPRDPDAEAARLRRALLAASGLRADAPVAVVLTDTAGRPWRAGQTDFALGAAGVRVLDDLRGGVDHDGRPLAVTARALADEIAASADLAKGKADGVPAALVRGLPGGWFDPDAEGAARLVRTGAGDWFARGHLEAVRAALGVLPGSPASEEVGVASVGPEPLAARVGRVVALALHAVPDGSVDVALTATHAELVVAAADPYELGRLVARVEVAAHAEELTASGLERRGGSVGLRLA
ncbi:coenzyme F420-0:L-glutamate ligase [Phycicoccus endophyticus]|uniref:Coenzyme F420-0:L-glutamate ligase n=1 Tax=Phycicoccus endophyticus TaxID=1690220 RepID=A0A7G9R340_9MICO|nr:coenzyme F420-0:L-glutamate ligase [Phycicoccus endophyticus]NHI20308.1 hypothetical protein [Phycicoccus endophyticus]QNN50015.1 coenzyme F420-0:L-glutamate ligase [Phycicoccus endophyticus]GGL28906.1 F420-0--gamma-glutamyl ligase [Phycicoccus endophyticus]